MSLKSLSKVELRKLNLKISRSETVPHVSAVQEGHSFMSLDLCNYVFSYGHNFLIRSAFIFLWVIINIVKSLSIWLHCSILELIEMLPVVDARPWWNGITQVLCLGSQLIGDSKRSRTFSFHKQCCDSYPFFISDSSLFPIVQPDDVD